VKIRFDVEGTVMAATLEGYTSTEKIASPLGVTIERIEDDTP
jgi:hypothetical protein